MDTFINLAKQGIEKYEESHGGQQGQQGGFSAQGGAQWNSQHYQQQDYHPSGQGQSFQHGAGHRIGPDVDADQAIRNASDHAGEAGGSELFGQAMHFLHENSNEHTQPVDEKQVLEAHDRAYKHSNASGMDASSIGGAAAMQILKQFTSRSGGSGGEGNSQTQLISMAMGEAAKLFESSGGSGNKQDAVNSAGMTVMKLIVKSKFGGGGIMGGGESGGLMNMVTKLL